MSRAYKYLPDHLVIQFKDGNCARLVIDFLMFEFLTNTEFGLSVAAVKNPVTRRLWHFMERLAASECQHDGEVDVRLLDLPSGQTLDVTVDVDEDRYLTIKGGS